jgi:hypothetical protein
MRPEQSEVSTWMDAMGNLLKPCQKMQNEGMRNEINIHALKISVIPATGSKEKL